MWPWSNSEEPAMTHHVTMYTEGWSCTCGEFGPDGEQAAEHINELKEKE